MEEIRVRLGNVPPEQVQMVLGAWLSGMGLTLLLMGLSLWTADSCKDHCCIHSEGEEASN